MTSLEQFLQRADAVLQRLEQVLPPRQANFDWQNAYAWRWRKKAGLGYLQPVRHTQLLAATELQHVQQQTQLLLQNTRQFVAGKPANHALLTGARGTGKSSLVKACLHEFAGQGLRLIEIDKTDLADLPEIIELVADRSERFLLFCDDLSFEVGDGAYKALKTALDGSVAATSDNVLIYATSNRRHLMPERFSDNQNYQVDQDGDIHPGETVEERISLSERFGLWISFHAFRQDDYLDIVAHWLRHYGCTPVQIEAARAEALRWALQRGSRSGRVAAQFARDYAGKLA